MGLSQPNRNSQSAGKQWGRGEFPTYKTKVIENNRGQKQVVFHQTAVVTFDQKGITLDTGGWWTRTTKTRMNQASETFGLGYRVFQKMGEWFVAYKKSVSPFNSQQITFSR